MITKAMKIEESLADHGLQKGENNLWKSEFAAVRVLPLSEDIVSIWIQGTQASLQLYCATPEDVSIYLEAFKKAYDQLQESIEEKYHAE